MKHFIAKLFVLFMMAAASLTMTTANMETDAQAATSKGQKVVNYAKKYVGNKYKYGGTSLTKGADCSGFTMAVYKKFGKKLPHSSSAQRRVGKKVSGGIKKAKPGDLICYSGHVAIYMGKNKIVHASNKAKYPKGGIKVSNNAKYKKILAVRRLV
ncbi:MAG TPA: C40 family peptidase [Candidatus Anaerostipes excrementavium]|uniref:C40 family peptidase n=1 Tax=Candidatus Anaerostipes excrementavium TaxID=2838463 RepID=A0A9D1WUH2_9FIRM|nr:C40 family peptidase [uncultured Anaerostipes sp.]HIX67147.1 C40 family peptidase [Candidatus Anaerostipes excrementavium]